MDAIRLAGVTPVEDGYDVTPHLPMSTFSLRLPQVGVAAQPGLLRGDITPQAGGDLVMHVAAPPGSTGEALQAYANGRPVASSTTNGLTSFRLVTRADQPADWALRAIARGCPGATGKLSGSTLGLVTLGITRARARRAYTHSSDRGTRFEDFFCLTPIGVRVGYASTVLLKTLSRAQRKRLSGRVVWASTSNAFYAVDGVRPGATLTAAHKHLQLTGPFHVGLNFWYLAPNGSSTAVLKVRHGIVEEIGIGDKQITQGHKAQLTFLKSFT